MAVVIRASVVLGVGATVALMTKTARRLRKKENQSDMSMWDDVLSFSESAGVPDDTNSSLFDHTYAAYEWTSDVSDKTSEEHHKTNQALDVDPADTDGEETHAESEQDAGETAHVESFGLDDQTNNSDLTKIEEETTLIDCDGTTNNTTDVVSVAADQESTRPGSEDAEEQTANAGYEVQVKKGTADAVLCEGEKKTTLFRVRVDTFIKDAEICLVGSVPELGSWDVMKALIPMVQSDHDRSLWTVRVPGNVLNSEYKYASRSNNWVTWEYGENRVLLDKDSSRIDVFRG